MKSIGSGLAVGTGSPGESSVMTPPSVQGAVEIAFRRSLSWLMTHRREFSFRYEGDTRDQVLLLKPFAEYVLTIDVLQALGVREPDLAECMAEAWSISDEGNALLVIASARPDMTDVAGIYGHFIRWGYRNGRLERWLGKLWNLVSTHAVETPVWRRIALHYNFWRLGLAEAPDRLTTATWLAQGPEPWTISDPIAYAVTHEVFYVTDFGSYPERFPQNITDYVALWLPSWMRCFAAESNWDLVSEFLMVAACLREVDGISSPLLSLLEKQEADGCYPAPREAGWQLIRPHHDFASD